MTWTTSLKEQMGMIRYMRYTIVLRVWYVMLIIVLYFELITDYFSGSLSLFVVVYICVMIIWCFGCTRLDDIANIPDVV